MDPDYKRFPRYKQHAEVELHAKYMDGDSLSGDLLSRSVIPAGIRWGRMFAKGKIDFEEMLSLVLLGITIAIQKFDPEKGPFGGCVMWYVRNVISSHLATSLGAVQVPQSIEKTSKYYQHALRGNGESTSLYAPLGDDPNNFCIADTLVSKEPNPFDEAVRREDLQLLRNRYRRVMNKMRSDRDRQILKARHRGETLEAIGKKHGLTKERIRQLCKRAEEEFQAWMLCDVVDSHAKPPELGPNRI